MPLVLAFRLSGSWSHPGSHGLKWASCLSLLKCILQMSELCDTV